MKYEEFKEAFEALYYELNRITETSAILANVARYNGVDNINVDAGGRLYGGIGTGCRKLEIVGG